MTMKFIHIGRQLSVNIGVKRFPKDLFLSSLGKLDDANIEKGVLVSKSGFTQSAKSVAKTRNISLIQLRKP